MLVCLVSLFINIFKICEIFVVIYHYMYTLIIYIYSSNNLRQGRLKMKGVSKNSSVYSAMLK